MELQLLRLIHEMQLYMKPQFLTELIQSKNLLIGYPPPQ